MVESQKVQKLQSSLLVFFQSNREKKKSGMLAKNKVNQEKIIKCPSFEQNFWTRTLGFRTTNFNLVLVRRKSG